MTTYFLYHPSIPFIPKENKENGNIIIDNISSFIEYLNVETFVHKECYFKHPVEGHWAIGFFMTIFYRVIKHQHCSTVNIHEFLTKQTHENDNKFTVLINTWQRNECLIKSVEHYLSCNDVAQIRIIWSDPSHDIPQYLRDLNSNKLVFDEYKDDKLTNRFKYNDEWITNAIFQSDDDIKYSCSLISSAFRLWQLLPDYMIGFAPREPYDEYKKRKKLNTKYQFYAWDKAFTECQYSMLFVTLGGFMHKKYYELYSLNNNGINGWQIIKNSVNGNITAEDISMSLFYTYNTGYPPIVVTVPESEMLIDDFLYCQKDKSVIMHHNSYKKRTNIYMDTLNTLGYYHNKFDLITSTLWIDVMPQSKQKCWAG